ncbi:MAG: molecular chaperone TorD family protein [Coriobacteriaceae bacterium]|nr:molecular chaperone TorD family protein [Coriobacteriaceae bacterium]
MSTSAVMTTDKKQAVLEVLRSRAMNYRMFSRLFLRPLTDQDIEDIVAMDLASKAEDLEGTGLLAEGFNDMGRGLNRRNTGTRQQLATDYTMCFDGITTINEKVAVPYASVFLSEEALLYREPRQKVYHLFRAEGIELKQGVNLPEDHLSFELEFLAILSDRAAKALEEGNKENLDRDLELSRTFIHEHILNWYDLFSERAAQMLNTRFYRGLLKATKGYLELDLETIDELEKVTDE